MQLSIDTIRDRWAVDDLSPELAADYQVVDGPQRQGDVSIWPADGCEWPAGPVPAGGVPVVTGEAGGNTHLLSGDGLWATNPNPPTPTDLRLGVLTVPDGGVAFLGHREHRMKVIGPGCYTIERQRERQRIVQD